MDVPKATVKRTMTVTMTFGYSVKANEIRAFLSDPVPAEAEVTVTYWKGDQHDPTQTTLTAKWDI